MDNIMYISTALLKSRSGNLYITLSINLLIISSSLVATDLCFNLSATMSTNLLSCWSIKQLVVENMLDNLLAGWYVCSSCGLFSLTALVLSNKLNSCRKSVCEHAQKLLKVHKLLIWPLGAGLERQVSAPARIRERRWHLAPPVTNTNIPTRLQYQQYRYFFVWKKEIYLYTQTLFNRLS